MFKHFFEAASISQFHQSWIKWPSKYTTCDLNNVLLLNTYAFLIANHHYLQKHSFSYDNTFIFMGFLFLNPTKRHNTLFMYIVYLEDLFLNQCILCIFTIIHCETFLTLMWHWIVCTNYHYKYEKRSRISKNDSQPRCWSYQWQW